MTLEPLRIKSIKKVYRHPMRPWEKVVAVNDISFDVQQGEIIGFAGHNDNNKDANGFYKALSRLYLTLW